MAVIITGEPAASCAEQLPGSATGQFSGFIFHSSPNAAP
jgi:hypothetical protein